MVQRFIVAEVSKTWVSGMSRNPLMLCELFERVIETNLDRGYELHSFQFHQRAVQPDQLVETIIAVFERLLPV